MKFFKTPTISEFESMERVVLEMEEQNLERMKVLSTAYFDEVSNESDIFYPISTIAGRIRSEFYPGARPISTLPLAPKDG